MTAASAAPKSPKIGIQLYMLGDAIGANLEETLAAVRAIGFDEVELPQTYGRSAKQLAAAITDAGLTCPSLHVSIAPFFPGALSFADGAAAVADFAAALGAKHVVVPMFPFPARLARAPGKDEDVRDFLSGVAAATTADEWRAVGDQLNGLGAVLVKSGVRLAYRAGPGNLDGRLSGVSA